MSDFTDKEMLRQMKTMNKNLNRIALSLDYLEHCFKQIRGKYTFQEGGTNDISEKTPKE